MKPKCLIISSIRLAATALLLLISLSSATAQTADIRWEKIAPPDEEFTALMPGKPEVSTDKQPYGQITISSRNYTVASEDGPLFMLSSLTGIESVLALTDRKIALTAAADSFRENFLKAVRAKGLKAEMTFQHDLKLNGHPGKEYTITMGDISGMARLYSTKRKALLIDGHECLEGR